MATATLDPQEAQGVQEQVVQPVVDQRINRLNTDELNPYKVFSVASHADTMTPVNQRALAQYVYAQRFGFDLSTPLDQMTSFVHGKAITSQAAAQQVAKWYEPFKPGAEGGKDILALQDEFTPAQVKFLRLATVQHPDFATSGLINGFTPDQYPSALALMQKYAGTTGGTYGANTIEGIKRSLFQRMQNLTDTWDSLSDQKIAAMIGGAGPAAPTPEQKLVHDVEQAQTPVIKTTGHKALDYASTITAMMPDLALGTLAGAGTAGAGTLAYFSTDVLGGFQKHLVYDEGLSPKQAAIVSSVAAVPYSLAMTIKADSVLKPLFKQELVDGLAKTWMDSVKQAGISYTKSWATGLTMATAQDATLEAAQKAVNLLRKGNEDDPGWTHVLENLVPNAITMAGAVAATHAIGAGARYIKGNPLDHATPNPGDPAKYVDQDVALQKAGVPPEHKGGEITQSLVDSYLANKDKLLVPGLFAQEHGYTPAAAKDITEKLDELKRVAPERAAALNEQVAAAKEPIETDREAELEAVKTSPVLPALEGEDRILTAEERQKQKEGLAEEEPYSTFRAGIPDVIGGLPSTVGDIGKEINRELSKRQVKPVLEVPEVKGPPAPTMPYNRPIRPLSELTTVNADGNPVVKSDIDPYEAHSALAELSKNEVVLRQLKGDAWFDDLAGQLTRRAQPGLPLGSEDVANNRLISDELYKENIRDLKKKLDRVSAGVDPTILKNAMVIGAYHLENGVRTFAEWSKKVVEQVGDWVKPHLADMWETLRSDPRTAAFSSQMVPITKPKEGEPNAIREPGANAVGAHEEGHPSPGGKSESGGVGQGDEGQKTPIEEGVETVKAAITKVKTSADKVVGAAYAMLRGSNPGKLPQDVEIAATRIFNKIGVETDLPPADLMRRIRETEINQRYDDKLHDAVSKIYRSAVIEGKTGVEQKLLDKGAAIVNDMLAKPADTVYKNITQLVQAAVRGGRKQAPPPIKTVPSDALDILEKKQKSQSKQSKLLLYDSIHQQLETALKDIHGATADSEEAAHGVLNDIFGEPQGKKIRIAFHEDKTHGPREMLEAINNQVEQRAKDIYAENLVRGFKGSGELTSEQQGELASLAKSAAPAVNQQAKAAGAEEGDFQFHIKQLEAAAKSRGKLAALQQQLDEGKITPEQFDKAAEKAEGQKSGLLNFFKNESYANAKALHDQLLNILSGNRQELYDLKAAKIAEAKAQVPAIVAEVKKSSKMTHSGTKGEGPLEHGGQASGDMLVKLGGVNRKDSSLVNQKFQTDVFNQQGKGQLQHRELMDSIEKVWEDNGFSEAARAGLREVKDYDINGQKVSLSRQQMISILASTERESTKFELARATETMGRHEVGFKEKVWRSDKTPGEPEALSSPAEESVGRLIDWLKQELTPAEQKVAHSMVDVINDSGMREATNAAHEQLTGLPLNFVDERYFPRSRELNPENPNEHLEFGSLEKTFSGAKPTQSNKRAVIYDDIDTTMEKWARQATTYAFVSPTLEKARTLLQQPEIQQAFNSAQGRQAIKRLHDTYSGIEGFSTQPEKNTVQRYLEKMQTIWSLFGNFGGSVATRLYTTGMAANKISMDHGVAMQADYLAHIGPSIGPTKLLAMAEDKFGFGQAHQEYQKDIDHLVSKRGYFADRFSSPVADTIEKAVQGVQPEQLTGKGWWATVKSLHSQMITAGLTQYMHADQKGAVDVYRWGIRNGMSDDAALDYAQEHTRSWAPPSNDFDYTRNYQRFLWARLFVPFTGAITRVSASFENELARFQQAETPAQKGQAAVRIAKFAATVGTLSLAASAFKQGLYDWRTGKDFDRNKLFKDTAFGTVEMCGFPYAGRACEKLADAFEHAEDPSQVTTVAGAGDVVHSILTIHHAIASKDGIDWSDPKQKDAAVKLLEGGANLAQIPLRGVDQNMRLLFPKEKQD